METSAQIIYRRQTSFFIGQNPRLKLKVRETPNNKEFNENNRMNKSGFEVHWTFKSVINSN